MLKALKHVRAGALAIALLLGVSSCTPPLEGSLSISVDDRGRTLVGICRSSRVVQINTYYSEDKSRSGHEVLSARGNAVAVNRGEVFAIDNFPLGFEVERQEQIHLSGKSMFSVLLLGAEGSHRLRGDFEIPADGLQEGLWLFPDGSVSERVCGRYDDEHERIQERLGNASEVKK